MILYLKIIGKKENITISVKCFIMSSLFHNTLPNFPLERVIKLLLTFSQCTCTLESSKELWNGLTWLNSPVSWSSFQIPVPCWRREKLKEKNYWFNFQIKSIYTFFFLFISATFFYFWYFVTKPTLKKNQVLWGVKGLIPWY